MTESFAATTDTVKSNADCIKKITETFKEGARDARKLPFKGDITIEDVAELYRYLHYIRLFVDEIRTDNK